MSAQVRFFVNGQAMTGGSLNGPLQRSGTALGPASTAPRYRFFSCRNQFPALVPTDDGWGVPGELYSVSYAVLRDEVLPAEPPELELSVIELADGSGALGMVLRDGVATSEPWLTEIEAGSGWRDYLLTKR
ncbi:gamma-glutamylcyclotransferase [soil metagenome]